VGIQRVIDEAGIAKASLYALSFAKTVAGRRRCVSRRTVSRLLTKREILERNRSVSAADQSHRSDEYQQRSQHD
jgi:hypothetical protein